MPNNTTGTWSPLIGWPLIPIHAILLPDGKVLAFGTSETGVQGAFIHSVWDPVTGVNQLINHHSETATDIFCSAAIVIPGTTTVLIAGGDARPDGAVNRGVNDVNVYSNVDGHMHITPATDGEMNFARWYPSVLSLPTGQVVVLGGTDVYGAGVGTPEIYTPGEGWRMLPGAADGDLASSSLYPRAFLGDNGLIYYFATGSGNTGAMEVRALDPSGNGVLSQVATLPFWTDWEAPSIMYEAGKVLIMASSGQLWTMDLTGPAPVFHNTGVSAPDQHDWSSMSVMANGQVVITGGGDQGNSLAGADMTALVWDPETESLTPMVDEAHGRLYHSVGLLLPDGTILSAGGGAPGDQNFLDGQIYRPAYLYDANGDLADRPVVSGTPASVLPGQTFTFTVDDASAIDKVTFVKGGAVTHSANMDTRLIDLDFIAGPNNTITVTLPANANIVSAGNWMLFAWNDQGVPSVAPMIQVQPTLAPYDGIGDLTVQHFTLAAGTDSLDDINFNATPVHIERASEIYKTSANTFYPTGPTDNFAVRYKSAFDVQEGGQHSFYLGSDDGARLYIDGRLAIDNDGVHGRVDLSTTVYLSAGAHTLEVRYFDSTGFAELGLDWQGPGFNRTRMQFDGAVDNLLVNGGLEIAGLTGGTTVSATLNGWTSSANNFEMWADNANGVKATGGRTFMEVDAGRGTVSQSVHTDAGRVYTLSFDYAGRAGSIASSGMEVLWNGTVIATITPTTVLSETYEFAVTGTGGNDTLSFRAIAGDNDSVGGLLDSVVLLGAPFRQFFGTTGIDDLQGTSGNDRIFGGGDADLLAGGAGNDYVFGNAGDDRIVWNVGDGSDVIGGDDGTDTVEVNGGDSSEIFLISAGFDQIRLQGTNQQLFSLIIDTAEVLELNTGGGNDTVIMSNGLGALIAIRVDGGGGDDAIFAADGNDLLDGGKGADRLEGGAGNDIYIVDTQADVVVEAVGNGSADRVMARASYILTGNADIELLTTTKAAGSTAINLTGNALAQEVIGNAGANILHDGGKGGADVLRGLGGNDIYRIFNAGDTIVESSAQGAADRVMAAVDYKLGAGVHVEIMTTNGSTGTSNIDLTGNEFAQEISGNAGNNRLEGKGGHDTLQGFGGADTFVFASTIGAANVDTVADFNVADDRFLLSDAVFKALSAGVLSADAFRANTTGLTEDADDRIIYQSDTGKLFYDANGTGSGGGIHFATVTVGLALTNTDFSVA
ncbi:galactose oxidase-like domain-containing protein [Mesorhizobium sp. IMUNJ 23232]|uniref:galactose oxidase-like domain-containing protein n=1 Tax=Mesorhizobium sp. IMUNJ 23232 TaxID=3376064 RepID=UPI003798E75A